MRGSNCSLRCDSPFDPPSGKTDLGGLGTGTYFCYCVSGAKVPVGIRPGGSGIVSFGGAVAVPVPAFCDNYGRLHEIQDRLAILEILLKIHIFL